MTTCKNAYTKFDGTNHETYFQPFTPQLKPGDSVIVPEIRLDWDGYDVVDAKVTVDFLHHGCHALDEAFNQLHVPVYIDGIPF